MSTGDDDSLIELARKVHVEIDRNEQIDSRMIGYLKRTGVDGASDVAAPSSATTSSSRLVHSTEGSIEQATTLQVIMMFICVNRPSIVREIRHFALFPAISHICVNVPHVWLYLEKEQIR